VVFLNQLRTLNKNLLMEQMGTLPDTRMAELNVRLALSLGLIEAQK
jgi:mRNA-degrading endonuclease toxin of MazEF toxin-antitoxin module